MSPEGGVDPRSTELREMETEKAIIDTKAEAQVKRELWAGLGLVLLQTTVFIRLTFWELSWDVMEPICFFTTSTSFMLGYAFFLRTANEPSFEGFFAGRFASRQQRLMKAHGFNLHRFNELRNALSVVGSISACSHSSHPCRRQSDVCDATLIRAAH
ncbi:hypothetical protein HPP92_007635 [Vanilla planifolia]|uniref:Calcium uniporter protein C-terminal domain-containing protein n=1 Tax=Vanilla planifolia TaxID=51239 RepID=A0A835RRS2_VANPL|nr:hypothetical protein HPP92_007635 [Vanilla planifolia]